MAEYRIDELARAAGTTSRNVRAYQERGLLPPPRKEGRVGIYTETHLARLRLITSLHERGYTTAQITELIVSWQQGRNLGEVLGLEEALNSPWTDEIPTYLPTAQVREYLEADVEPELFDRVVALGVLKPDGEQCLVPSPQLVSTFAELVSKGFRLTDVLALHEAIAPAIEQVARRMVQAGAARLFEEHGQAWLPSSVEVAEVTALLQRLRQLAMSSVQGLLAHAMERQVADVMGEHLVRVIRQNLPDAARGGSLD
ncbi:MAG TPA: MerR family transcriptional regulator [Pseudonocardia sp.]|jgi:DNA-binding transcriptional MerR regulator|uniref:MerR family transcriptional regulator n=1 Tax=Pseudonocardia sp. TaxID=60912 RepID=UPI002F40779B